MLKATVLVVLGALAATHVMADPAPLSLQRAAAGADAAVRWIKDDPEMKFVPSAWASYSIATNLSAFGSQEYNATDGGWGPGRAGLRMYVPQEPVRVALGANYLKYWDRDEHSWSVGLYAGWHVKGRVAASAAVEKDVPKDETSYRLALRVLALGGK